jgi:hypothetical protein
LVFIGIQSWCPGRCRGAATLPQQEKNKCSGKSKFYPFAALNYPGAPKLIPAAPLVVFSTYMIVVSRPLPRRRDAAAAGEEELC